MVMNSMELNGSSSNSTPGGRTAEDNSHCYPVPDIMFETLYTAPPYFVNAALNIVSAILATVGNILVFVAIRRVTSIHLPSKLLLYSLVLTDLGVGLIAQPQYVVVLIMKASKVLRVNCFLMRSFHFASPMLSCVSLLTMTAISLDRYFALVFHRQYHTIVTAKRVSLGLIFICSFAVFYASLRLWSNSLLNGLVTLVVSFICLILISVSYIKIYRALCHQHGHQLRYQAQQQSSSRLNVTHYRRLAFTMLYIYILFIVCYSPYFCARLVTLSLHNSSLVYLIREFFYTLLLCNSTFNPLVYCFRLPDIRAEVLKQLRKCRCSNL